MASPVDKPNFEKIAMELMFDQYTDSSSFAYALRDMYEQGYHVGLIYGWGIEQEKDLNGGINYTPTVDMYTVEEDPDLL